MARAWSTPATSAAPGLRHRHRHRRGRRRQRLRHGLHRLDRGHLPRQRRAGPDLQRRHLATPSWPRSRRTARAWSTPATSAARATTAATASPWTARATPTSPATPTPTEASFPVSGGPDLTYNGGAPTPSWPRSTRTAPAWSTPATSAAASAIYGLRHRRGRAGNAYVTGSTDSTETTLPGQRRAGPDLQRRQLATPSWPRSRRTGTGLVYAGYIGGSGDRLRRRHRRGRRGQRLRHRLHRLHRGHLPGQRRAGPDLQRRPRCLRGQGQGGRHGARLRRLHRRLGLAIRATASPWTAPATPTSPAAPSRPRPPSRSSAGRT